MKRFYIALVVITITLIQYTMQHEITYDEFCLYYAKKFLDLILEHGITVAEACYKANISSITYYKITYHNFEKLNQVRAKTIYNAYITLKKHIHD
jgi:predicted transcriptional regulator